MVFLLNNDIHQKTKYGPTMIRIRFLRNILTRRHLSALRWQSIFKKKIKCIETNMEFLNIINYNQFPQ